MKEAFGNPYTATVATANLPAGGVVSDGGGIVLPHGDYRAFAIGPQSEYDQVRVDGHLLAAGRVLPLHILGTPKITYERGPRARLAAGLIEQHFPRALYHAHVLGFECGDQIVNPGPRPGRTYRRYIGTVGGGYQVLRVPFAGRRHGRVFFPVVKTQDVTYYVVGVNWSDDDTIAKYATEPLFGMALLGSIGAGELTAAQTADDANGFHIGNGRHFGGTNDAEYCDEVAVVFRSVGAGSATDVIVEIEVAGEEGVG